MAMNTISSLIKPAAAQNINCWKFHNSGNSVIWRWFLGLFEGTIPETDNLEWHLAANYLWIWHLYFSSVIFTDASPRSLRLDIKTCKLFYILNYDQRVTNYVTQSFCSADKYIPCKNIVDESMSSSGFQTTNLSLLIKATISNICGKSVTWSVFTLYRWQGGGSSASVMSRLQCL